MLQKVEVLKMSNLIASFKGETPEQFYKHCNEQLTSDVYDIANELTVEQFYVPLWFALRAGRITASTIYEASCSTTMNQNLIKKLLGEGVLTTWNSPSGQRGVIQKGYVFNELLREFPGLRKSGLVVDKQFPVIAASPDGSSRFI